MTQVFRIIREHRIHHGDTEATEKSGKIDILSALSVYVVKCLFLSTLDGIDTSKRFITLKTLVIPMICSVQNRYSRCVPLACVFARQCSCPIRNGFWVLS